MVLATLAIASTTPAQAVRGRVYDLETGAGVSGAEVALWRMTKPAATVRTDSTGYFMIALSDTGSYELVSRRIGYFDADGHFYFTGRMGDLIKSSGMNITPRDVIMRKLGPMIVSMGAETS